MSKKPNVLVVFADEWRGQALGYAGDTNAETPHLDAFAARSLNCPQAVSGCSVCCPYRASLITGQYSLSHGVFINDVELDPDSHSIAHSLSAGGYHTTWIGKWHLYGSPEGRYERRRAHVPRSHQMGFDDWWGFECSHGYNKSPYYHNDDPTMQMWEGYDAFAQTEKAIELLKAGADDDRPQALFLSWGPPHFPLHTAPDAYRDRYAERDIALRPNVPESERAQAIEDLRGYYAHIAALDDAWARLMQGLEEADLADDTIILFTADHGDMRSSHGLETKLFPWDGSVCVPFLLNWAKHPEWAGQVSDLPIDSPDIMPTLLGLLGLPIPDSVEGRDWSPILRGEAEATGDEDALLIMAAEFTELRFNGMRAYRGLRNRQYTYVRNLEGPWLLYDNQADPYRKQNLIANPEHAAIRKRLDAKLQARLDDMGDAFEDGLTLCERAGYSHYKELHLDCRK